MAAEGEMGERTRCGGASDAGNGECVQPAPSSRNVIYTLAIFAGLALAIWRANTLYQERRDIIDGAKASALDMARDRVDDMDRALDTADLLAEDARFTSAAAAISTQFRMPNCRAISPSAPPSRPCPIT